MTSSVALTLDEDLDPLTMSADAITVSDAGGAVLGTTTYDPGTRTLTWSPRYGLVVGSRHFVSVDLQLRTSSGQSLLAPEPWEFTTRDGTWHSPEHETQVKALAMDRAGAIYGLLQKRLAVRKGGDWTTIAMPSTNLDLVDLRCDPYGVLVCLGLAVTDRPRCSPPASSPCYFATAQLFRADPGSSWHAGTPGTLSHCGGYPYGSLTKHAGAIVQAGALLCSTQKPYRVVSLATPLAPERKPAWHENTGVNRDYGFVVDSASRLTELPSASANAGAPDDHGRVILLQEDRPEPDRYRLRARYQEDDGTFTEPVVVHESSNPFQATTNSLVIAGADGLGLVGFMSGPQPNGDPTWTLRHLRHPGQLGPQVVLFGRIVAADCDWRGTFWIATLHKQDVGPALLVFYRYRDGQDLAEMPVPPGSATQSYAGTRLAFDACGRACFATQLGIVRFE